MDSITEITLLGGQRHRVDGDVKEVEQLILDATRGSIMQLAWFTDAQTASPWGSTPNMSSRCALSARLASPRRPRAQPRLGGPQDVPLAEFSQPP
jgi:hypothetical protein